MTKKKQEQLTTQFYKILSKAVLVVEVEKPTLNN